jgi:hypothetical protein
VEVGTAWEDSSKSGLETGEDEGADAMGMVDLGADEAGVVPMLVEEEAVICVVESVGVSGAVAEAGAAEESTGVTGKADWDADESEGVNAVEPVEVSGAAAEAGVMEAFKVVAGKGVEVGGSCVGAEVGIEETWEAPPSLLVAGTDCKSGDVGVGVLSAVVVEAPAGDKAAGVPLTGVKEVPGVGIDTGNCCGGMGLVGRWMR